MLYRVGDPLVEDRLDSLPSELERAGQADLVRTVRCVLLGEKSRGGHSLESGQKHLAAVCLCLEEDGADITASFVANEAAQAVLRAGDKKGAVKAWMTSLRFSPTSTINKSTAGRLPAGSRRETAARRWRKECPPTGLNKVIRDAGGT